MPREPEPTGILQGAEKRALTQFKPGQSGNPNGREKGSRNKLVEQAIADIYTKWQQSGMKALDEFAEQDPGGFVRVVAGLMPKEIKLDITDERTDQQIEHSIRLLAHQLGLALDLIAGTQQGTGDPATSPGQIEAQPLQAV